MILDTLDHAERYFPVHPGLAAAVTALRDPALLAREDGRYPLDGERLVAIVQRYDTKPANQCAWEAHRRYVDVQFVARGVEAMGHLSIVAAPAREGYDAGRDVQFFHPPTGSSAGSLLVVPAGSFAVFFPHDVHSPCVAVNGVPQPVLKVVVKMAVNW